MEGVLLLLDDDVVADVTGLQSYRLEGLPPGGHGIEIVAIDRAGNRGEAGVAVISAAVIAAPEEGYWEESRWRRLALKLDGVDSAHAETLGSVCYWSS